MSSWIARVIGTVIWPLRLGTPLKLWRMFNAVDSPDSSARVASVHQYSVLNIDSFLCTVSCVDGVGQTVSCSGSSQHTTAGRRVIPMESNMISENMSLETEVVSKPRDVLEQCVQVKCTRRIKHVYSLVFLFFVLVSFSSSSHCPLTATLLTCFFVRFCCADRGSLPRTSFHCSMRHDFINHRCFMFHSSCLHQVTCCIVRFPFSFLCFKSECLAIS